MHRTHHARTVDAPELGSQKMYAMMFGTDRSSYRCDNMGCGFKPVGKQILRNLALFRDTLVKGPNPK